MKPKDRDLIETKEGLLFCVVGYLHHPDRYTAYLKYIPTSVGKWARDGKYYSRVVPYYHVTQVENTYKILKEDHPKYLFNCPVRNILVSAVPKEDIKNYYLPQIRLKEIIDKGAKDSLEEKLVELTEVLRKNTGLSYTDFGVTGSILTRNHNPDFSDIDLTIHGMDATHKVRGTILELRKINSVLEPFSDEQASQWCIDRTKRYPLSFDELRNIVDRRWNYGYYKKTYASFHPIRIDSEINEIYGDVTYSQEGQVTGTAKISNNEEAAFLPALYKLEDVDGVSNFDVRQLISYEGMFSDIFKNNERVEFSGIVEKVSGKQNFYRVVIGGSGSKESYVKLV